MSLYCIRKFQFLSLRLNVVLADDQAKMPGYVEFVCRCQDHKAAMHCQELVEAQSLTNITRTDRDGENHCQQDHADEGRDQDLQAVDKQRQESGADGKVDDARFDSLQCRLRGEFDRFDHAAPPAKAASRCRGAS